MSEPGESVKLSLAIENNEPIESLRILSGDKEGKCLEAVGPLHVTALQLAAFHGWTEFCVKLGANGADVNTLDKIGRSALYCASQAGHWETAKFLLECGASTESKVEINPLHEDSPGSPSTNIFIGKNLPLPECWGRTALHQAVKHNHPEIVKLLISYKANVNVTDERGVTPLLLAGSNVDPTDSKSVSKYVEIVGLLVSAKAMTNVTNPDTGSTALHHAVTLGSAEATAKLLEGGAWPLYQCSSTGSTALHIAASAGHVETLAVLLAAIHPDDIDTRDKVGRTSLHRASYQGHRECIKALIDHGGNLAAETNTAVTVIDAIFAHTPRPLSFLTDILDTRVQSNGAGTLDKNAHVTVDFGVLAPKGELQMGVVSAMIMSLTNIEELAILQHPLVETFLHLKWSKQRYFFFVLVLINVLFVVSLSCYGIILLDNVVNCSLPRRMLIISSCVLLFHNVAQILIRPRHYLKQLETWLSVVCATIALITSVVVGREDSLMALERRVESVSGSVVVEPPQWALHSVSVAILFGWMEMMLLIGRFPMWGYYALMFSTVLKNVLKVLLAFVCLIVGFALSFAVLFHGNDQFRDSWRAAVKTVVMMMGEYEYRDLFAGENSHDRSFFPATSRIVFLAFVMLASIVLMNLMIGLAVSDIQGLEKEGHIRRLLKQAEFMAHLEKLTSYKNLRSNRALRKLRGFFCFPRDIPTKITFGKNKCFDAVAIPGKLIDALFLLAFRSHLIHEEPRCQSDSKYCTDVLKVLSSVEEELRYLRKFYHPVSSGSKLSKSLVKLKTIQKMKNLRDTRKRA